MQQLASARRRNVWFSCEKFTIRVVVDGSDKIKEIAPIGRKFRGQKIQNLERWANQISNDSAVWIYEDEQ